VTASNPCKRNQGDRPPVTPSDSRQTGQGNRISLKPSKHLHVISQVPKIPIAEKKREQPEKLISYKEEINL
jgi:hypothetical protein